MPKPTDSSSKFPATGARAVVAPAGESAAGSPWRQPSLLRPVVSSELALMRFVAGMRALLAMVVGIGLVGLPHELTHTGPSMVLLTAAAYLLWAALLMWKTLQGWPRAASRGWPWIDVAVLLYLFQPGTPLAALMGALMVLPVVALALLGGVLHGVVLAVVSAGGMLALSGWHRSMSSLPTLSLSVPIAALALGPVAALLAQPGREWRQRVKLLDRFQTQADPRHGLPRHLEVLAEHLAERYALQTVLFGVRGLEPRVFLWREKQGLETLADADFVAWRARLETLGDGRQFFADFGEKSAAVTAIDAASGRHARTTDAAVADALRPLGRHVCAMPLASYGKSMGYLALGSRQRAFGASDLRWIDGLMSEALPLLERSDLLEQLQVETSSRERERIGRDLHDSAVQPYVGLKYGLEALAHKAKQDNPLRADIQQLARIADAELGTLRDVIGGLRAGQDPTGAATNAPLAALQRQAERFESLYGLRVHIFAPQAPRLRGTPARALLHMVNEALTNVRRHTSATAVTVLIDATDEHLLLRLRNDHGPAGRRRDDFVPRSLSERAAEFGGTVDVSHDDQFTEVAIRLPLMEPAR